MQKTRCYSLFLTGLIFLFICLPAYTEVKIDIRGIGQKQASIAILPFIGENIAPQKVSQIISQDFSLTGQFNLVDITNAPWFDLKPDFPLWRNRQADYLLQGAIAQTATGFDIRWSLWDLVIEEKIKSGLHQVDREDMRFNVHQIADIIYESLIGEPGIFASYIAYVLKKARVYELIVADVDGANRQVALTSSEPIISPSWSPDGQQLAYVSFESYKPVVYIHTLSTGTRRILADFKGSNSAPAWSPDGEELIITASLTGGSKLFTLPSLGGKPTPLMPSFSIDTEGYWAEDGYIYFVSDRGGTPQIYRIATDNREKSERLTFLGNYNVSPVVSSNGKYMAFINRYQGQLQLTLMSLQTGETIVLTNTTTDESPSFSPNGQLILYTTQLANNEVLMVTTLDGTVRTRLQTPVGDVREPAWGPVITNRQKDHQ
jgi:TolB protein